MRDMIKKMTGRGQTKYKRLSQRCVNNKKGVSLVGVIVAFLLLMIIMLMFQKSLKVSGNLIASIFYFGDGTTGYENRSSAMSDGGDEQ